MAEPMDTQAERLDFVARTARWTAAARAAETERPDRLFTDFFARSLAGPAGVALMERFEQFTGGRNPVLPIRTRFFDEVLTATTTDAGLRQVVLLAAGFDCRAFRLAYPADTIMFELDRPDLLAEKKRTLAALDANPVGRRRTVGADLSGDWAGSLRDAGYDASVPALWIAEGLLSYLPAEAVRAMLTVAAELSPAGSRFAADALGEAFLTSDAMAAQREALLDIGAPWQFGTDEPERLFADCGWLTDQVIQPGEPGADFRDLPYPVAPRDVDAPGVPRILFITARRAG
jgi:methyltransferase (TIGR00027 family)